jgi:hypothetical protein
MDWIHLSPLVDQIQLALGHISNIYNPSSSSLARTSSGNNFTLAAVAKTLSIEQQPRREPKP